MSKRRDRQSMRTRAAVGILALVLAGCGGTGNRQSAAGAAGAAAATPADDHVSSNPPVQYFHEQLIANGEDLQSDFGSDLSALGMNPRDLQQDDPEHAYDLVLKRVKTVEDVNERREMMRTFFNLAETP